MPGRLFEVVLEVQATEASIWRGVALAFFWMLLGSALTLVTEVILRRPKLFISAGNVGGGIIAVEIENKAGFIGHTFRPRRWMRIQEYRRKGYSFERSKAPQVGGRLLDLESPGKWYPLVWRRTREGKPPKTLGFNIDIADGQRAQLMIFGTVGYEGRHHFDGYYPWTRSEDQYVKPGRFEVQVLTNRGAILLTFPVVIRQEDAGLAPMVG